MARYIFYTQQKRVRSNGERGRERMRKREMRRDGENGCGVGHKLERWSSFHQGLEVDFIKMSINLILRIWGHIFRREWPFYEWAVSDLDRSWIYLYGSLSFTACSQRGHTWLKIWPLHGQFLYVTFHPSDKLSIYHNNNNFYWK